MGQRFLIDTNVISDYVTELFNKKGNGFLERIFHTDFVISVVVKIEALSYKADPANMKLLEEFLATAVILPLDDHVTQRTIELRRKKKLTLGDAIIAATALTHNLTIITRNIADFKNIPKLMVINPHTV